MNFKNWLLCPAIFLCCFRLAAGDPANYSIRNIPPELFENAEAVIRFSAQQFEMNSPTNAFYKHKKAVTVLSSDFKNKSLEIHYGDNESIENISARIYDADGNKVREIKKNEIKDFAAINGYSVYEDARVKFLDFSYGVYPYTFEFEYTTKLKSYMWIQPWTAQEDATSVQYSEYVLKIRVGLEFNQKISNFEPAYTFSKDETYSYHHFTAENLPALGKEPFSPPAYLSLPAASFSPKHFVLYGVAGSFESWESFGNFYKTLCEGRDQLSMPMEAEVKKLVQNATSDEEKIAILYKFLQKNMRYVSVSLGIGGWQPFDAQYVETNKYGDCKALTNFMKSILKVVGIESYPVLVYAGNEKIDMHDDFFASVFNHAILYVPGSDHWLECTSISYPPGYLGTFAGDRDVLVVTANGGKKMHTPDYSKTLNSITRKAFFKILDTGEAALTDQVFYCGEPHDIWRAELVYRSEEEIQKDVMKSLPFSNPVLHKFTIEPDVSLPEAWVKMDLSLPRYASTVGKRLFVPVNKINNIGEAPAGVENRKTKVFVDAGLIETDTLIFEIPEGYQLEGGIWTPVYLTSAFGEYSAELVADQKAVTFIRRFKKTAGIFPSEAYAELCSFYREILKSDNRKLVFAQKTADNKP